MPGPITLVMKKRDSVSSVISAGLDTVAVRMPQNKVALRLISEAAEPVAAPSANLSGKPSPTEAKHVINDMSGRIDAIIASKACDAGVESTVVDVTGDVPVILRPGVITYEDILSVMPSVVVDKHVTEMVEADEVPKSPGMKYKHYSPDADVIVVEGRAEAVKAEVERLLAENSNVKTGVISYLNTYGTENEFYAGADAREFAHNLFSVLREIDEQKIERVFAEFYDDGGCSMAVKNRLYKAAGYNVIRV